MASHVVLHDHSALFPWRIPHHSAYGLDAIDVGGLANEGVLGIFLLLIGGDDIFKHPRNLLGADLAGAAGAALDDLAEGNGAAHGLGIGAEILGEALFGEGLPTTDDAGGAIDVELVALVLEQLLDAGGDFGLVDGEEDDLVVGEEL